MFICGQPSDVYISIGQSPTIDILFDFIFRQPSEPFSQELPHALTPIVLRCPSAYGMHDANFHLNSITHANI